MTEPIVLTVEQILDNANTLCDDNINHKTLLVYFNKGIDFINARGSFKFPIVSQSVINKESNAAYVYDVCTQPFANNKVAYILINYVAMCIKETDGYPAEANTHSREFTSLLLSFTSQYIPVIKPEYLLTAEEGGNIRTAEVNPKSIWMKRTRLY